MPVLKETSPDKHGNVHYLFWCPGCEEAHAIVGKGPAAWTWNGELDKPTFSPSYLCQIRGEDPKRCHSYIREGRIQYLSDCTHALAGKTVDLPDFEEAAA